jgi:Right handed beta helix region
VHLAWSDPHRELARRYEIERRAGPSAAWANVARVPADRPPHYDDAGQPGEGLAPGDYEYRVRGLHRGAAREAWSEWSPPQRIAVLAGCADAGGELARLPRVVADDLDGDGRYTGADLERALRACAERGGCVIEALPVTYDDVAIVISDGDAPACSKDRTACLTDRFPNGLAIEGHGRSTVLRSPLWKPPHQPEPVLELWRRPDVRLQLRHLVLDGRKNEQRDPLPGENNSHAWRHMGLQVWNRWSDHDKPNRGGCVHDVAVRGFMSRGVSLADVARWSIEHSSVEDIGCMRDVTPCSRLTVPDPFPAAPGFTSTGFGIHIDWHSDDVTLRANRVRRVTKYSIGFKHGQDAAQASIRRLKVVGNDIEHTGQLGIFLGGVADALFEDNRIAATDSMNRRPQGRASNDTFGVSCYGAGERIVFRRNRIEDMAGMAISWGCQGRGNVIEQTRIARSCRQKNPESCTPGGVRTCYYQPDVLVAPGATGDLALVDTAIEDSGCAAPLAASPAAPGFDLVVRGGRYAAGAASILPVQLQSVDVIVEQGATFTGTALDFGPGTRGVVAPTVSVTGKRRAFRVDPGSQVLVCPDHRSDCEKRCAAPKPPRWCSESGPAR